MLALRKIFGGNLAFFGAHRMADIFFPDVPFRSSHVIAFSPAEGNFHAFNMDDVLALRDEFDGVINLNWWDSPQLHALSEALDGIPFLSLSAAYGHVSPIGAAQHVCDYTFQVPALFDGELKLEDFSSLQPVGELGASKARCIRQLVPSGMKMLAVHTLT